MAAITYTAKRQIYNAPTLDLDFAGKLSLVGFGGTATFSRADATTCATYFNSSGVLTTAAANVPRFDYDPVTKLIKGLLIEESRTNLLLNTETLSTQNVTVTAQAYTLSFYGTGTVTLSGTFAGSLVGTGVYPTRVNLTFTPSAGTLTLTVTGTVTKAQLEAGTFPTSYIPTTSTALTRAADVCSITLGSWYNSAQATALIDYRPLLATVPTGSMGVLSVDTSGRFVYLNGGNALMFDGTNILTIGAITQNVTMNLAAAFSSSGMAACKNGGTVVTQNYDGTWGSSPTTLYIGSLGGSSIASGHYGRVRIYNTRQSNTSLVGLTGSTPDSYSHTYGYSYNLEIDGSAIDAEADFVGASSRALGGATETLYHRADAETDFTTDYIAHANLPLWQEFFYSTAASETFTFDPYGTIAAPSVPVTVERVSGKYSPKRINTSMYYTLQFRVRNV